MEKSLLLRIFIYFGVVGLLMAPVLILLAHLPLGVLTYDPFIWQVLVGAFQQSILSLVVSLFLGILGAFGLLYWQSKCSPLVFQSLVFLGVTPSLLPAILVVTLGARALGGLPLGLWGVVFFHALMNIGLVSLIFYRLLRSKAESWVEFSRVAGVSPMKLVISGLMPELKGDLLMMAFYLLVLFFFSFSIPFLVGGIQYAGLEVYIYEKVLFLGQWGQAISYSLILFALLLVSSQWIKPARIKTQVEWRAVRGSSLSYLGLSFGGVVFIAPLAILVFGFFSSMDTITSLTWDRELLNASLGTLSLGLMSGLFVFVVLSLLSFSFLGRRWNRLLNTFMNPGWVVVGFSMMLLPGEGQVFGLLKASLALTILYLPFLFRVSFSQSLEDLRDQVEIAQSMPVSWGRTFLYVVWPQCLPTICLLSGLTAMWASGDFAISGILFASATSTTLAFEMQNLLTSYRLEQAIGLLLPLLLTSIIVFLIFQGLSYVSRRQTLS